jgi:hypothetical protein
MVGRASGVPLLGCQFRQFGAAIGASDAFGFSRSAAQAQATAIACSMSPFADNMPGRRITLTIRLVRPDRFFPANFTH